MGDSPYELDEWPLGLNIVREILGAHMPPSHSKSLCQPYAQYCGRQWTHIALHAGGQDVSIKTLDDTLSLIRELKSPTTRTEIAGKLQQNSPSLACEKCCGSIDLIARLLTMVQFGHIKSQTFPTSVVDWSTGSLRDFLATHFKTQLRLQHSQLKLPKSFDALSLSAIGGIEIKFTNNLDDHLRLDKDDTLLHVFHHAWFLKNQPGLYPEGLVKETLDTLALLFPKSEFGNTIRSPRRKMKFFRKLCSGSNVLVDEQIAQCGNLRAHNRQFENFSYWHDRLVILKQAYDDASPKTLSQWWYDRRNGVQWWMFWIVIFLFFVSTPLTVLQCVQGAIQIYKAYYPSA